MLFSILIDNSVTEAWQASPWGSTDSKTRLADKPTAHTFMRRNVSCFLLCNKNVFVQCTSTSLK